jgi:hypothetical protein
MTGSHDLTLTRCRRARYLGTNAAGGFLLGHRLPITAMASSRMM